MAKAVTGTKAQQGVSIAVDSIRIVKDAKMVLAFVDLNIGGVYVVKGFKVIQGKNGTFIAPPQKQGKDGKYYDQAYPTTRETRNLVEETIMAAYKNAVAKVPTAVKA